MPVTGGADDCAQVREVRLPAQNRASFFRVSNQPRRVAGAGGFDFHFDRQAGNLPSRFNHFQHRIALAVAEVDALGLLAGAQMLQS